MASGMARTLYPKAHIRLMRIVLRVCLESSMALGICVICPPVRVIAADSIASAEPVPIAKLTSDLARACASLIPSPTMATTRF